MDKETIKKELVDESNNILAKYSEPDIVESVSVMNMAAQTVFLGSLRVYDENNVSNLLLHGNILTYFISSLVGLIPNCAGSVIITELYLANMISIGTMLAGLLTGSGLGILLLFKTN